MNVFEKKKLSLPGIELRIVQPKASSLHRIRYSGSYYWVAVQYYFGIFKLEVLDFQPHLLTCAEFVNGPDKFVTAVNTTVNIKHRNSHKHCRYQCVQLSISRTQIINISLQVG
jgi:hypothetical protein